MNQTTIVFSPAKGESTSRIAFLSEARPWNADSRLNASWRVERNGLWATAVWGTKGAWAPDTFLETPPSPFDTFLMERKRQAVN